MSLYLSTFVSNAPDRARTVVKPTEVRRVDVPVKPQEYCLLVDEETEVIVLALALGGREVRHAKHSLFAQAVNALDECVEKGKTAAVAFATDELPAPEVVRFLAEKGYIVTRTRAVLSSDVPLLQHALQRGTAFIEALRDRLREGQQQLAFYQQHAATRRSASV